MRSSAPIGGEQPQPLLMAIEAAMTPVIDLVLSRWTLDSTCKLLFAGMPAADEHTAAAWLLDNRSKTIDPFIKVHIPDI